MRAALIIDNVKTRCHISASADIWHGVCKCQFDETMKKLKGVESRQNFFLMKNEPLKEKAAYKFWAIYSSAIGFFSLTECFRPQGFGKIYKRRRGRRVGRLAVHPFLVSSLPDSNTKEYVVGGYINVLPSLGC